MQGVCPAFGHGYPVERDRASSDREGRFGAKHTLNAPNHTARESLRTGGQEDARCCLAQLEVLADGLRTDSQTTANSVLGTPSNRKLAKTPAMVAAAGGFGLSGFTR